MVRTHLPPPLAAVAALCLSACAATTPVAPSASPTVDQGVQIATTPRPLGSDAGSAAPTSRPAATSCAGSVVVMHHQAPELEAVIPASVQGRPLSRWSVRGRCWAELMLNGGPAAVDRFLGGMETSEGVPIDPETLAYAVAGRSDTSTDPPYFVWVAHKPLDEDALTATLILLLGGAGYADIPAGAEPANYTQRTIAGKDVYVGAESMVDQDVHQRGRPYFYETEDYLFLVLTDDDAWATDAIGQLP